MCPKLQRGLIAIDEDYKVVASNTFKEDEMNYSIGGICRERDTVAENEKLFSGIENFQWHFKNVSNK